MEITQGKQLLRSMMNNHGLNHWTIKITRTKRGLGSARYSIDNNIREIKISKYLFELGDEATIKDVILHEIAHAKNFEKYGIKYGKGHGYRWQMMARSVGANPERQTEANFMDLAPYRFYLLCPKCDTRTPMYRRVKTKYICAMCRRQGIRSELQLYEITKR